MTGPFSGSDLGCFGVQFWFQNLYQTWSPNWILRSAPSGGIWCAQLAQLEEGEDVVCQAGAGLHSRLVRSNCLRNPCRSCIRRRLTRARVGYDCADCDCADCDCADYGRAGYGRGR